jgi:hypothetical protein
LPTLVEKTILVEQKVSDLWGLFMDLRRADFKVRNVAADARGTYVYLETDEDKDPTPVVEAWVGKDAPKPSPILKDIRAKELRKVKEEEDVRRQAAIEAERKLEEQRAKLEEAVAAGAPMPVPVEETPATKEKVGVLKRIFRKFF